MRTRGESWGRRPAWTSWMPAPEPASTRKRSSPRASSVAGPRRAGLGGGEPVPRSTARIGLFSSSGHSASWGPPHPALSPSTGKRVVLARGRRRRLLAPAAATGLVRADGHRHLGLLPFAHDGELHDLADRRARDDALQVARLLHGGSIDGHDHVVGLHAGLVRGLAGNDLR